MAMSNGFPREDSAITAVSDAIGPVMGSSGFSPLSARQRLIAPSSVSTSPVPFMKRGKVCLMPSPLSSKQSA